MYYWKQWKQPRTRRRNLLALGADPATVHMATRSRKSDPPPPRLRRTGWRTSQRRASNGAELYGVRWEATAPHRFGSTMSKGGRTGTMQVSEQSFVREAMRPGHECPGRVRGLGKPAKPLRMDAAQRSQSRLDRPALRAKSLRLIRTAVYGAVRTVVWSPGVNHSRGPDYAFRSKVGGWPNRLGSQSASQRESFLGAPICAQQDFGHHARQREF